MTMHRLSIEDFQEEPFKLVAIHCSHEAYQLCFLMNRHLDSHFERKSDHSIHGAHSCYEFFDWYDCKEQSHWRLVSNKCVASAQQSYAGTLFETNATINYLVPEHKRVDYFLKFDDEVKGFKNRLSQVQQIPQIIAAYEISTDQLKSKTNLIFD